MIYEYINSESELGDLELTVGIQNLRMLNEKMLIPSAEYVEAYKTQDEYKDQQFYVEAQVEDNGKDSTNLFIEKTIKEKEIHFLVVFKFNAANIEMVLGDSNRFLFKNYVLKLKDKQIIEFPRLDKRVNIEIEFKRKNRYARKENNEKRLQKACLRLFESNFYINEKCDKLFTVRMGSIYNQIDKCEVKEEKECCINFRYLYGLNKWYDYDMCLIYDEKEPIMKDYCVFRKKQLIKEFEMNCLLQKKEYEKMGTIAKVNEILKLFKR